jgi:hypothetical protein
MIDEGLADVEAGNPFRLPTFTQDRLTGSFCDEHNPRGWRSVRGFAPHSCEPGGALRHGSHDEWPCRLAAK